MDYFRPTRAEINLDNLQYNYLALKKHVGSGVNVMGILKANAYGHGIIMCANELLRNGADYFGVATVDEAIQLRKAGITTPILLLGFAPKEHLMQLVEMNLTYNIYDLNFAKALSEAAGKSKKTQNVHIKCDTGMGRLGFKGINQTINSIKEILKLPYINIEGIFSHFADAESLDNSYTNYQLNVFMDTLDSLRKEGIHIKYRHIANSSAVINMPQAYFNMVRPGICLYGLYSSERDRNILELKNVMTFKTEIAHIKTVSKGEYLGYGCTYQTKRKSLIATLPVGYGDGYKRTLSNNSYVIVNNQKANLVGLICMDQCMIDVTDVENVKLRDEVILFGDALPPKQLADRTDTIHHEFVAGVGIRVPRIYYKEGRIIKVINNLLI